MIDFPYQEAIIDKVAEIQVPSHHSEVQSPLILQNSHHWQMNPSSAFTPLFHTMLLLLPQLSSKNHSFMPWYVLYSIVQLQLSLSSFLPKNHPVIQVRCTALQLLQLLHLILVANRQWAMSEVLDIMLSLNCCNSTETLDTVCVGPPYPLECQNSYWLGTSCLHYR